jgi:hypothetical protein
MDPLVIASGLRKLVDLLLGDLHPLGSGHMLANASGQIGQGFKCFHTLDCMQLASRWVSMT